MNSEQHKERREDGNIFIGDKEITKYLYAAMMQLNQRNKVNILSRGKFTARAIDVAEMLKRQGYKQEKVEIGSEEFVDKDERKVRVSIIEIGLVK